MTAGAEPEAYWRAEERPAWSWGPGTADTWMQEQLNKDGMEKQVSGRRGRDREHHLWLGVRVVLFCFVLGACEWEWGRRNERESQGDVQGKRVRWRRLAPEAGVVPVQAGAEGSASNKELGARGVVAMRVHRIREGADVWEVASPRLVVILRENRQRWRVSFWSDWIFQSPTISYIRSI